jgi:pyruvate dehydrogenase E1 component alpha subunit
VEAVSFRHRGHSVIDPDRYRDDEIVKHGRALDPVPAFAQRLLDANFIDEQGLRDLEDQVEQTVANAVKFAEESSFPGVDTLFDHIYAPEEQLEESK